MRGGPVKKIPFRLLVKRIIGLTFKGYFILGLKGHLVIRGGYKIVKQGGSID